MSNEAKARWRVNNLERAREQARASRERKRRAAGIPPRDSRPFRPNTLNTGRRYRYGDVSMRSPYEVAFARWLDQRDWTWAYEPEVFDIGGHYYTPDFWVDALSCYVEIDNTLQKPRHLAFQRVTGRTLLVLLKDDVIRLQHSLPGIRMGWHPGGIPWI